MANSTGMLDGKIAVITGAAQGIGKACTKVFVREGAKVLAVDFSGKEKELPALFGPAVVPFHADVSKEPEIEAAFAAALETFGRVDSLVNVAGTQASKQGEVTLEEYELMTATNLKGVLLCCKHAIRAMLRSGGGSISSFTSVGGLNAEDMAPIPYSAAKAGVHSISKSYAVEYGNRGIRVNAIACGFTLTEMMDGMSQEMLARMNAKPALKRAALPSEQAEVAAFLASDRASFITGAIIPVDGGWTAKLA
jgi:NAD(P)-dependent dehydrogenase (short-subunit alcohol dehydrogenase family)